MSRNKFPNQRQHFRLRFLEGEHLTITIAGARFPVTEVSERGLRIRSNRVPHQNGDVAGVIQWSDGELTAVAGVLARYERGEQVLVCVDGIEMRHIVDEQRLINRQSKFRVVSCR